MNRIFQRDCNCVYIINGEKIKWLKKCDTNIDHTQSQRDKVNLDYFIDWESQGDLYKKVTKYTKRLYEK